MGFNPDYSLYLYGFLRQVIRRNKACTQIV